jgi:hypothetical protein
MATMSRIYNQIDDVFYSMEGTAKVVVDSAFAAEDRPSLVNSFSNNVRQDGQPRQPHRLNNYATSVRQMAEWGMQGFQSSFPRLKEKILYEEKGEWKIMLNLMVLLYNFRVAKVGQNQIQSVYMPFLSHDAQEMIN